MSPRETNSSDVDSKSRVKSTEIGLIAGAGSLPTLASRILSESGHVVRAIGFEGLTDATLAEAVVEARFLRLGQLENLAAAMSDMGIHRVLLLGKVPKSLLFDGREIAVPDEEAIRLLAQTRDRGDEPLMRLLADWLTERGFWVCDQSEVLAPLIAVVGSLSAREPNALELSDSEIARSVVQQLGRAGVGQCVVAKEGSILAVEAIEGTDAVIRRAGALAGGGATVVKAARPGQDRRFDLPAIGETTINVMSEVGASALAIEAGSTLIVDLPAMTRAADRADIAVWSFPADPLQERSSS